MFATTEAASTAHETARLLFRERRAAVQEVDVWQKVEEVDFEARKIESWKVPVHRFRDVDHGC